MRPCRLLFSLMVTCGLTATANAAPILGQIDDFEDGTTDGWRINLVGTGMPPAVALPANIATGGPGGADDNYLRLTSLGVADAGGRLTAANPAQWAGDYVAAGITAISMDVRNLGPTDLTLRLLFEDPVAGPPVNVAVSTHGILVPVGGDWVNVIFPIAPGALTAVLGDVNLALTQTTVLRIFHGSTANFPGEPTLAQLGVDNITAEQFQTPEPAILALFGLGGAVLVRRRSRQRRQPGSTPQNR